MANRETSIACENLNRRIFSGVGEYGIPQIKPETFEGNCEFVGLIMPEENAIIQKRKLFISSYMITNLTHYGEIQTGTWTN